MPTPAWNPGTAAVLFILERSHPGPARGEVNVIEGGRRVAGNSNEPGRTVTSKTVAILSAFTVGGALTLSELAHQTDIPVSTVYRHVRELARVQVLERGADRRYSPSPGLRSLIGGEANASGARPARRRRSGYGTGQDRTTRRAG